MNQQQRHDIINAYRISQTDEAWKQLQAQAVPTIYVIVENIPVADAGEYTVEECICISEGYFTNENLADAEKIIKDRTRDYLKGLGYNDDQIENDDFDDEIQDDHRDRFGYIPLDAQKAKS